MPRSPRDPRALRQLAAALRSHHWLVVVACGIGTLVLSMHGIDQYCAKSTRDPCPVLNWLDKFYLSVRLFIWESGDVFLGKEVPPSLQIARLAAPVILGYAALRGLLVLFADQYHLLRARWSREHIVVCGLGSTGLMLVERFHAAGWRVVSVELNKDNPSVKTARKCGPVLVANATDRSTMLDVAVRRARHLVAVCGDDAVNAEIAAAAGGLLTTSENQGLLTCHVHIADPDLCDRLRAREMASRHHERLRLQYFNVLDAAGRALAGRALATPSAQGNPGGPHVLMVGLGAIGERMIVHAARSWRIIQPRADARFQVMVVDPEATRKVQAITLHYPRLEEACRLVCRDVAVGSRELSSGAFLIDTEPPFTTSFVCLDDDATTVSVGLALLQRTATHRFPVVLCAAHEKGLSLLLNSVSEPHGRDRITMLDPRDLACVPEVLLGGINETLAREIHEEYRRTQLNAGHVVETNPAVVPWDELPEHLRESNRQQADHIGRKLAAVGCGVAPLTAWQAVPVSFEPEEITLMARMEHDRWVRERQAEGWRYDPAPKDLQRRTSPYLVDWDALTDDVKELDRNTVRELPAFLARTGFCVYRSEGPPPGKGDQLTQRRST